MTLNGRYALYCRKNASFEAQDNNLNENRHIPAAKCRPMTLVFGGITFMRIFTKVSWRGSVKRQQGCRQRQFLVFSLAISSETLEMRPALSYSDTQSVVGFFPKCMTLNDPERLFHVNFCFRAVCLASHHATFEINCMKTEKKTIDIYCRRLQIFGRDSSFCQFVRFVRIFAQVLQKRGVKAQWRRALSRYHNCDSTTIGLRYDNATTHSTTTEVIEKFEITICVRFDCDMTTTRLRRKTDMFIFARVESRQMEAGPRETSQSDCSRIAVES